MITNTTSNDDIYDPTGVGPYRYNVFRWSTEYAGGANSVKGVWSIIDQFTFGTGYSVDSDFGADCSCFIPC